MNQPSGAVLSSLTASIPSAFKPSRFTSLVSLPTNSTSHSVLTPSHKRSNPPTLKLSDSPKISISDFDHYLQELQSEWSAWEKNLNLGSEGAVNFKPQTLQHHSSNPQNQGHRLKHRTPPPLSQVPEVFFQSDFTITNPTTFDLVTESSTSSFSSPPSNHTQTNIPLSIPDLATDQLLQEKLSYHLDVVELNLVEEISRRSASFFSALGNLQSLHAETASCITQVERLNTELASLRTTVADKALEIVKLGDRRQRMIQIEEGLAKVQEVWQSVGEIEALVQAGDGSSALNLIESLEACWRGDDHGVGTSLKFDKLKALNGLPNRLSNLRGMISRALEADLVTILSHDLKLNIEEYVKSQHSLDGDGDSRREMAKERLEDRLRASLMSLMRASEISKLVHLWREAVMREVRDCVRRTLVTVTDVEIDEDQLPNPSDLHQKRAVLSEKT